MKRISGKSVFEGIALGPVLVLGDRELQVNRKSIQDVDAEVQRLQEAIGEAQAQLQQLYEQSAKELGEGNAAIFHVHQLLLEDEEYQKRIQDMIQMQQVNSEYAVSVVGEQFVDIFASMTDEYMRARAADIKDITIRLIKCLGGEIGKVAELTEPVIIVAEELTPSETVVLDKSKILAFVTSRGSTNSHTAILARTMNIPALVAMDMKPEELQSGQYGLVNGFTGELIVEPSESQLEEARAQMQRIAEQRALLQELKGKEAITLSGKKIVLNANIGSLDDLESALVNDAEGIGLFRSEFLYIGRDALPGEEEQFEIYKQAVQMLGDKPLVVRTLDIGADKQAEYLPIEQEENPAMGYRGIRVCLENPEILQTQLRALYRAAVYGNLSIMYPMIISVEEVQTIKQIAAAVKTELSEEGIPYRDVQEGVMIETPAAALISDELAKLVDFFSIGTNDLTQYTLAIDRQNAKLDSFYNPHHRAVLRLIQMVADNAHKAGKRVAICGELAADTELTKTFVDMGIDELSAAPGTILTLRSIIRGLL